ncbi:MAG: EAL domain-containing protein [Rhodocyclaceae bacterium]|nr:EAL domain-containing protein [Rhodocyclaceae bacterium]
MNAPPPPPAARSAAPTNWLIGIAVACLVGVLGLKAVFDHLQGELAAQDANERARLFVGEEIVRGIHEIEKGTYRMLATDNAAALARVRRHVDAQTDKLLQDIQVLRDGGRVERRVVLNIEGRDEMVREATYRPDPDGRGHVMEIIEIAPLLDNIRHIPRGLESLLLLRHDCIAREDHDCLMRAIHAISAFLKQTPPRFERISENANRLFYDGAERLRALEIQLAAQRATLKKLELGLIVLVILMAGAAAMLFARQINRSGQQLALALDATRTALLETREEHARLDALLSNLKDGILFIGRDDRVLYANPALYRIWLIPPESALVGLPAATALVASANVLAQPDHFSRLVLKTPGTQEISDSTTLEMTDGRVITQLCHPVRDNDHRLIGRLWVFDDVTQERRSAEQLIYLAERDGLTGLYNRRRFEETLERALADTERRSSKVALLFFDLDEFKNLNDHFGHRAGDAMLTRVANEISTVVRKNETLARLGGDEFAVLVPDLADLQEAQGLAERIVRAVARIPFSFDGRNLSMTTSLGIAIYPDHAATLTDLVICADVAMYRAKGAGKNGWRLYDGRPDDLSIERLTWNERLQNALDRDLLVLHYQGIHAPDGRLLHVEALMRMRDEERPDALIAPSHFIPQAERTGKIRELDRWAVAAVVAELARLPGLSAVAVNVSARSLADIDFPGYILDTLARQGVAPRRLLLELTETAAMGDLQDARRFLEALQPAGCRVCLDDFGTGFCSFAYLKHINADVLKIDGQFVRGLADDRANQLVVRAIVDVARGMGKMTIAEFVEDAATLELLRDIGVDAAQGYHLSMPRADAASLL